MARSGGRGLRIIAGEHRGSRLHTPPGKLLRPMRDQVRGALFNILGAEGVEDAVVLDLFAGSGSLGLEALSRGAARALFIDREPRCLEVLERNVAALRLEDRAVARRYDLLRGLRPLVASGPFDLVLVHPPFELLRPPEPDAPARRLDVTALLSEVGWTPGLLAPEARVAFETPRECYAGPDPIPGLELLLRREYGSTALFVARARPPEDTAA